MTARQPPDRGPTQQALATRLDPQQIIGLLGRLQRQARDREDRNAVAVLGAVILWLNTTSAVATAAARRLQLARCPHCHAELSQFGEASELIERVRQVQP